jgi:8-oxo-dGTP pyrophosphatase MutT (NUDIX family)
VKICDNRSVGVIIRDPARRLLVFERATFPVGIAPVAGHVDDHGSDEDAARAEVREEVGLTVTDLRLIGRVWRGNRCRRSPGPRGIGHMWALFEADVTGDLDPSERETRNARWITEDEMVGLCHRTADYAAGRVTEAEFAASPGIEPVWVPWVLYVSANVFDGFDDRTMRAIDRLAGSATPPTA